DEFIVAGRHFVPGSRGLGGGCGVTWRSGGFFVFCHGALPLDRRDCGRKRYGDGRLMVRRRMLLLHPFRPGWDREGYTPRDPLETCDRRYVVGEEFSRMPRRIALDPDGNILNIVSM